MSSKLTFWPSKLKFGWIDICLILEVSAWTSHLYWSFDSKPEFYKEQTLSLFTKCLNEELYWTFIENLNILEEIEFNIETKYMKNEKDELIFWKLLKHNKTTEASVEFIVLLVLVVDMVVSVESIILLIWFVDMAIFVVYIVLLVWFVDMSVSAVSIVLLVWFVDMSVSVTVSVVSTVEEVLIFE